MTISWLSHGEADVPTSLAWLTPRESERAAGMRFPKRRSEFLLSRWTAKSALARRLGLATDVASLTRLDIRNASDGAPEAFVDGAPAPLVLSMTDRAGWAVCALGEGRHAIGCDLELIEPRTAAFVSDYLTRHEQHAVAAAENDGERHRLANLLWSAKESALKVLRTGLRRDTRSVEVRLADAPSVDGWSPLTVWAEEGRRFPGWWRRYGLFLLTIAAEVETPPPVAIVHPPRLAEGVPTHSWLAARGS